MMKRLLAILMSLAMILSLSGVVVASGEEAPESSVPVIEKPVYITISDDTGKPVSGVSLQILDTDGNVVKDYKGISSAHSAFLNKGSYTIQISGVPEGYIVDEENCSAGITIDLEEAEEKNDIPANTVYDDSHPEICIPNYSNLGSGHVGIERYTVLDVDGAVTAWCFNQNYDNPYSSPPDWKPDYDPSAHTYKRLVGTPELLYNLAQNKSDDITPQDLYDHVLAAIYLSQQIQEEYGFDDALMEFLVGRAIKNYTDPKCFLQYDDDGNLDYPNGTVWGSVLNHAKRAHNKEDLMVTHPEYREAYYKLIGSTYHPNDYYLYIYYPENWEPGNNDTDQCMMSVFTVEPVRTTLKLRQATGIEITKTWSDANDQDGYRPTAEEYVSMVKLLADGADVTAAYSEQCTVTDNGDDTYTVSFANLPKLNDDKAEIEYTIEEIPVDHYTADNTEAADGGVITNTHEPETTEIEVHKIWDDHNDADGLRPESITVNLLADGKAVQTVEITPDENGDWAYTFSNLPKFKDHGVEIVYTVTEEAVPDYETLIEGFNITNRHAPELTEITVHKTWRDANDEEGMRPASITIHLLADGETVETVKITPDENGNWMHTFTGLPKYKDGNVITYTITEDPVPGYSTSIDGFDVTNSRTPPTGDMARPGVLAVLMVLSLSAVLSLTYVWRRRHHFE
jgi:hypothetical protein